MKNSFFLSLVNDAKIWVLILGLFIIGCDQILSVDNPNNLTQENINLPSSASGLKNGLLHQLMVGIAWTYASTSTVSDEIYWVGSYESYKTYNEGRVDFPNNEITVNGFPEISQARYLADVAIEKVTQFDQDGELEDRSILAKIYIYSAITRITIANSYDNFVFSTGKESNPPIGEDNMKTLYDEAISEATEALNIAQTLNNSTLRMQALGIRAQAKHAKGIWQKLNPKGSVPEDPIVSGTGAPSDAQAALELMPTDYKAQFNYQTALFQNYLAQQVNSRGEIRLIDTVSTTYQGVTYEPILDPKTGKPNPEFEAIRSDFLNTQKYTELYSPLTWLSWREMQLIIAEEAIGSDNSQARARMNAVRELDNLPTIKAGDDLVMFIEYERRANLFLEGRRLNDMYRFGTSSSAWLPDEVAEKVPGTLLPIPSNERDANPEF